MPQLGFPHTSPVLSLGGSARSLANASVVRKSKEPSGREGGRKLAPPLALSPVAWVRLSGSAGDEYRW